MARRATSRSCTPRPALPEGAAPARGGGRLRGRGPAAHAGRRRGTGVRGDAPRARRRARPRPRSLLDDGTAEPIGDDALGMSARHRPLRVPRARRVASRRCSGAGRTRRCSSTSRRTAGGSSCASGAGASRSARDARTGAARRPRAHGRRSAQGAGARPRTSAPPPSRSSRATSGSGPAAAQRTRRRRPSARRCAASGVRAVMSHASYLINLASPDPAFCARSRDALRAEMAALPRARHPLRRLPPGRAHGRRRGRGPARGRAEPRRRAVGGRAAARVMPLAGGHRRPGLVRSATASSTWPRSSTACGTPERVGVCLDTCHLYAAGYDIATPRGYERTMREFDRVVGLRRLKAIHLNDSRKRRWAAASTATRASARASSGSRRSRASCNDPRCRRLPMVVETPGPLEEMAEGDRAAARPGAPARRRDAAPRASA